MNNDRLSSDHQIPRGFRKATKRTVESTSRTEETIEEFDIRTGRIFRRVVRSNVVDAKISEDELVEPNYSSVQQPEMNQLEMSIAADWFRSVPNQMKASLFDPSDEIPAEMREFVGDYFLICTARAENRVRWEYRFPKDLHGMNLVTLEAEPEGGCLNLTLRFQGTRCGPQWIGVAEPALQREFTLHRDRNARAAAYADTRWPNFVTVLPLPMQAGVAPSPRTSRSFVISPDPTPEELEAMAQFADASSSSCKVMSIYPETTTICVGSNTTFSARGKNLKEVTWDTGGNGTPATGKGSSFITRFDEPGTYTVTASCNESSATATVTAATISFSTGKVITGITKNVPSNTCGIEKFTIVTEVIATVTPASVVDAVVIGVDGAKRVNTEIVKDAAAGKITIKLTATSKTPPGKENGDTKLQAKLSGRVCQEIPVIVLAPYAVVPVSTAETRVNGENKVADKCSSPAYAGSLSADQVYLWTVYGVIQDIRVNDQFGVPLNAIYDGAPVFENVGGWKPINQNVSGGHYSDPVGREPVPAPSPAKVLRTNPRVAAWPNATPQPAANGNYTQNIPVQIAGVELVTGIQNRNVKVEAIPGTTSANVTIDWMSPSSP